MYTTYIYIYIYIYITHRHRPVIKHGWQIRDQRRIIDGNIIYARFSLAILECQRVYIDRYTHIHIYIYIHIYILYMYIFIHICSITYKKDQEGRKVRIITIFESDFRHFYLILVTTTPSKGTKELIGEEPSHNQGKTGLPSSRDMLKIYWDHTVDGCEILHQLINALSWLIPSLCVMCLPSKVVQEFVHPQYVYKIVIYFI